ncbi:hypothetical protein HHI36_016033 [Cryptolaemus montrouzieri]|uniref:Uncharacterized protein n=1 Tax=Cryptolaemus montrouzieri TaxID=559131 RepID=A0ABD2N7P0_9CUCU
MREAFSLLALSLVLAHAFTRLELVIEWAKFQNEFGRSYTSSLEAEKRFSIFENSLREVEEHNRRYHNGEVSYTKGINDFSDWTDQEFMDYVNQYEWEGYSRLPYDLFMPNSSFKVPNKVDWRSITRVKNQGRCRSCWAFGAVGSLEAQLYLRKGKDIALSEQNLIDCSWEEGNEGCTSGTRAKAYEYIYKHGLQSERDYPYEAKVGKCRFKRRKSVVSISGYVRIRSIETHLIAAVASMGPVSIAFHSTKRFSSYKSGILEINNCKKFPLNHAAVVVGYGRENGKDYYIIKNSWGRKWGEQGYFRLGNRGSNPCGVAERPFFPKVV